VDVDVDVNLNLNATFGVVRTDTNVLSGVVDPPQR
jgi:hypothetical protein